MEMGWGTMKRATGSREEVVFEDVRPHPWLMAKEEKDPGRESKDWRLCSWPRREVQAARRRRRR